MDYSRIFKVFKVAARKIMGIKDNLKVDVTSRSGQMRTQSLVGCQVAS
jgi:hypothetical protein